jgi:methyltransferase
MLKVARILQYVECPQYLRKHFFPFHKDLQHVGLLNPLDAPHHLRSDEECQYREGVVLDCDTKQSVSQVDVGLSWNATINGILDPQTRVTVKFNNIEELTGEAVPCTTPRTESGLYWGYDVRVASNFSSIFLQSPHQDGYDLIMGISPDAPDSITSSLGTSISFQHACIVFSGRERNFDKLLAADDKLEVKQAQDFFDLYANPLPSENLVESGSSIRIEEALLISLSVLRPHLTAGATATAMKS